MCVVNDIDSLTNEGHFIFSCFLFCTLVDLRSLVKWLTPADGAFSILVYDSLDRLHTRLGVREWTFPG